MGSKGGSSEPTTSIVQPTLPKVPNQDLLNGLAQARAQASIPYVSSPWRAMDYMAQYQTPTQYMPQFHPQGQQAGAAAGAGGQNQSSGGGRGAAGLGSSVQDSTPPPVPQTPPLNLQQNWWQSAGMPVPSAQTMQGMQQNVSPSLGGLFALLSGQTPNFLGGPPQMPGQMPDTNGMMQRPPMTGVPGAGGVDPNVNLFNLPPQGGAR